MAPTYLRSTAPGEGTGRRDHGIQEAIARVKGGHKVWTTLVESGMVSFCQVGLPCLTGLFSVPAPPLRTCCERRGFFAGTFRELWRGLLKLNPLADN